MAEYTIGQVAQASQLASSAIRYYERVGLITPTRRAGGQRRYDESALSRLAMIGIAKEMGFSLSEIKVLVDGIAKGDRSPKRLRILVKRKLPEVEAMLRRAQLMKRLFTAIERCECPSLDSCITAAKRAGLVG